MGNMHQLATQQCIYSLLYIVQSTPHCFVITAAVAAAVAAHTAVDVRNRVNQLQQLLAHLTSADGLAARQLPAVGDEGGFFLQQLLQWRRLRKQVIAAEIQRLEQQLPAHS